MDVVSNTAADQGEITSKISYTLVKVPKKSSRMPEISYTIFGVISPSAADVFLEIQKIVPLCSNINT